MPVPAYNTFNEVFDRIETVKGDVIIPFKIELVRPDDFVPQNWPVQPGNYQVLNPKKSIALAYLQGVDINDPNLARVFPKIAIAGTITTENHGVEHLVKNVIANPYLRHLVIWGDEIDGHLPGDALLNLSDKGLDKAKRINGARGARPLLKNLTENEVSHFRKQIMINNLIGGKDISELANILESLVSQATPPFESGLKVDLVEVKKAQPAKRLKLDRAGYFVIMLMKDKENPLQIEHYSNDGRLRNIFEGNNAKDICATLIENNLVSQLDHAAYLGRELEKAEMSLHSDSKYIQDKA